MAMKSFAVRKTVLLFKFFKCLQGDVWSGFVAVTENTVYCDRF